MSKGFGKKALLYNKKGSKTNSNNNSPTKATPAAVEEDDKLMVKFVFEGEKFHARTPICFDQLTLPDLLKKISLDITLPPPSAHELFESYFKEDIYPYIRHNIQSQIRNKRDITKLWDLQSIILQKIYEERSDALRDEWLRQRRQNKNNLATSKSNDNDQESIRKKAELKAKNKANKQKWKDEIAMQIASGQFDEPKPKKEKEDIAKSHKKKKKEKKNKSSKAGKPVKKKKFKKWKDKKPQKMEEWPTMSKKVVSNHSHTKSKKMSAAQQLKENLKKMEGNSVNNGIVAGNQQSQSRKLISSALRYRLLLRGGNNDYVLDNDNESKQVHEMRKYIENLKRMNGRNNDLLCITIWIYLCEVQHGHNKQQQIWLNTDRDQVQLTVNQSKLFEILWNDFGNAIKQRIDSPNIHAVFVKKTKMLRLKIPILSI